MYLLITANIISFLPFLFFILKFIDILYQYIKNKKEVIRKIIYFYFLVVSTFSAEMLKVIVPYPKWFYKYSMRPKGAENCDYFSSNGPVKINTPGLPSGHMTTTTFVMLSFILENIESPIKILLSIIFIIMMGWARIYKKCHNKTQVLAGTLLGSIFATIYNRYLV